MKKQYEVACLMHVAGSVEDDFESVEFEERDNYREAVKLAKQISKDHKYSGRNFDAAKVICHLEDDISTYNIIFEEFYIDGVKVGRQEF